ncbi:MAG: AlpA family phage regulatory protein [Pseudomonadota bacterium]|nr:AlpA family phage regulatory protein [Pseudomonadota bacterium]
MQSEEPSGLMTTADLVTHLRMSRITIWRKRREGDFPQPCQTGHSGPRWSRQDIDYWLDNLPRFDPIAASSRDRSSSRPGPHQ